MNLWQRLLGTKNSPEDKSTILLLIQELAEARRDAVRMAETAAATLDKIVTARYDRPERVANVPNVDRSPMSAQASLNDDAAWLKHAGIVSDPEQ
jgi:hypothetical protein